MKSKMTFLGKLLSLVVLLGVWGCSSNDDDNNEPIIKVESIELPETLSTYVGLTNKLEVKIKPESEADKVTLIWSSSDEAICTVDEQGVINGLQVGEATITVSVKNEEGLMATTLVKVVEEYKEPADDYIIEFADDAFGSFLAMSYDKNNDFKIQYGEIKNVQKLNLNDKQFESIEGIHFFKSLEELYISSTPLTSVNLSNNKKLKIVVAQTSHLREIDITGLAELEILNCKASRLNGIDVTTNTNLKELYISMNHEGRGGEGTGITALDVTKNAKLEKLDMNYINVSKLDLSGNPELKWIDFSLSSYTSPTTDAITEIDFSNNTKLEYIAANAQVRTYDIYGELVSDKKGLSTLDVSMLPNLKDLSFSGNSVKSIDLSANKKLEALNCTHNFIKTLDLSSNVALTNVTCAHNEMKELNLGSAPITNLDCANNALTTLDISKTEMSYMLANDNKLTALSMGDKVFTTKDKNGKFYLYMKLNDNELASIDLTKQVNLTWLEIKNNKLTDLDLSNCPEVKGILASNNAIAALKLPAQSKMWDLRLDNNKLAGDLDLSAFTGLSTIHLQENSGLNNIKVWPKFKENCSGMVSGQTVLCYIKDDSAKWVK